MLILCAQHITFNIYGGIDMAKNKIQFQRGISISDFMDQYGTEQKCRDTLFELRWPDGFVCPKCDNKTYCEIKGKRLLQCNRCHHQTSLIAGTIFQSTHLPLNKWFLAIFLLTQTKNGVSALELSKQLGVSYNAAWRTKHKLILTVLRLTIPILAADVAAAKEAVAQKEKLLLLRPWKPINSNILRE